MIYFRFLRELCTVLSQVSVFFFCEKKAMATKSPVCCGEVQPLLHTCHLQLMIGLRQADCYNRVMIAINTSSSHMNTAQSEVNNSSARDISTKRSAKPNLFLPTLTYSLHKTLLERGSSSAL